MQQKSNRYQLITTFTFFRPPKVTILRKKVTGDACVCQGLVRNTLKKMHFIIIYSVFFLNPLCIRQIKERYFKTSTLRSARHYSIELTVLPCTKLCPDTPGRYLHIFSTASVVQINFSITNLLIQGILIKSPLFLLIVPWSRLLKCNAH